MPDLITELAKRTVRRQWIPTSPVALVVRVLIWLTDDAGLRDFAEIDELLDARHVRGIATYGVSLSDADLTEAETIQHAREEAADLLKYLIKLALIRAKKVCVG